MENGSIQVLDRAFCILEALCKSRNGMSIQQLCEETGMNKSTVHRLLHSMMKWNYVRRAIDAPIYCAGMRICELGEEIQSNFDIIAAARPILDRLSEQVGATVHLANWEDGKITYIYKAENRASSVCMTSRVGIRRPMYCTSVGKAILSTLPDSEIERIWDSREVQVFTPFTITKKSVLMEELCRSRQCGYALDNEENELGICCIGTAIPDRKSRPVYAISISLPVSMAREDRRLSMIEPLLSAKKEISALLGTL